MSTLTRREKRSVRLWSLFFLIGGAALYDNVCGFEEWALTAQRVGALWVSCGIGVLLFFFCLERAARKACVMAVFVLLPGTAHASGGSGALSSLTRVVTGITSELSGEFGRQAILLALLGACMVLAFTEHGHGLRKIGGALVAGALLLGGIGVAMTALGLVGATF